jgi:hypothetical protein
MSNLKIKAWMDYNKEDKTLEEVIYFKRPTTKHTNPDIVSKEVIVILREKIK